MRSGLLSYRRWWVWSFGEKNLTILNLAQDWWWRPFWGKCPKHFLSQVEGARRAALRGPLPTRGSGKWGCQRTHRQVNSTPKVCKVHHLTKYPRIQLHKIWCILRKMWFRAYKSVQWHLSLTWTYFVSQTKYGAVHSIYKDMHCYCHALVDDALC